MELSSKHEAVLVLKDRLLYKLRKLFHKFEGSRYSFRNKLPEPNLYKPELFAKRVHPYVFVGLELRPNSAKPVTIKFVEALDTVLSKLGFNELIDTGPSSYKAVFSDRGITAIVTLVHDKGSVQATYLEVFSEDIYD